MGMRAWLAGLAVGSAAVAWRRAVRRARWLDLGGATVLVTGGSRGLGLLLAEEFGRHRARVALCARDAAELDRARTFLASRGIAALALACDVTDRARVDATVREVEAQLGPIDVLVNNAGVATVGPHATMTIEDYEEALATHFWGPLYATLAVLPSMRRRRRGRIVNIASIGGKVSVPHLLPYSASKFALVGLSEGLRAELLRHGVLVTTVCPGLMRTGSPRHARFKGRHRAEHAWFAISDSLPGLSMDASRAARRIVEACRRGEAEVVLSLPAKAAAAVHGVLPGLTADLLAVADRLLPRSGGIGTSSARGADSASVAAPSWLTALGDRAASRLNQLGAGERRRPA